MPSPIILKAKSLSEERLDVELASSRVASCKSSQEADHTSVYSPVQNQSWVLNRQVVSLVAFSDRTNPIRREAEAKVLRTAARRHKWEASSPDVSPCSRTSSLPQEPRKPWQEGPPQMTQRASTMFGRGFRCNRGEGSDSFQVQDRLARFRSSALGSLSCPPRDISVFYSFHSSDWVSHL